MPMLKETRLVALIRSGYMVHPVVLTTRKPVREVVGMHARLSIFVRYFLKVKKMLGGNVFVSVYKRSIIEGRNRKTLAM